MPFLETKGPKSGRCNICGESGKLTTDHVPPKGVIKFPRMRLYNIMEALQTERDKSTEGRDFQQGVKFRSVCATCNGDLLGGLYDPALIEISNKVGKYLNSLIARPSKQSFSGRPSYIARAVLGHILAIGINAFPRGVMGDAMAEAVLNPDKEIPSDLRIYYWVYPYWDQVAIRSFGLLVQGGAPPLVAAVLKYFPIGFMVTWQADPGFSFPHNEMTNLAIKSSESYSEVPFHFENIPPQRYPEAPSESGATFHGKESYYATYSRKAR